MIKIKHPKVVTVPEGNYCRRGLPLKICTNIL